MKLKSLFLTLIFSLSLTTATPTKAEIDKSLVLSALAGAWYGALVCYHWDKALDYQNSNLERTFNTTSTIILLAAAFHYAHKNETKTIAWYDVKSLHDAKKTFATYLGFLSAYIIGSWKIIYNEQKRKK